MIAEIRTEHNVCTVDLSRPHDISLPLRAGADNPNAFFVQNPAFTPFRGGNFVGSVAEGGACNCENLLLNPHGNGTHTECIGHITSEHITINEVLREFMAIAVLASIEPESAPNGDRVITAKQMRSVVQSLHTDVSALVLRTLPNDDAKRLRHWSGTNPPYHTEEAAEVLAVSGIRHLLLDIPSIDREEDGGKLLAHKAFWQYPYAPRREATITEMAFIPSTLPDGAYLLNLQIASIESDASPSKPILYSMI